MTEKMIDFVSYNFIDKEARKKIEKHMPNKIRKEYKKGQNVNVKIHHNSNLKRWSPDRFDPNYDAIITITKNGRLLNTNLTARAWGLGKNAWISSRNAISYFVYGKYGEDYEISYEMG